MVLNNLKELVEFREMADKFKEEYLNKHTCKYYVFDHRGTDIS